MPFPRLPLLLPTSCVPSRSRFPFALPTSAYVKTASVVKRFVCASDLRNLNKCPHENAHRYLQQQIEKYSAELNTQDSELQLHATDVPNSYVMVYPLRSRWCWLLQLNTEMHYQSTKISFWGSCALECLDLFPLIMHPYACTNMMCRALMGSSKIEYPKCIVNMINSL